MNDRICVREGRRTGNRLFCVLFKIHHRRMFVTRSLMHREANDESITINDPLPSADKQGPAHLTEVEGCSNVFMSAQYLIVRQVFQRLILEVRVESAHFPRFASIRSKRGSNRDFYTR